MSLSLISIQTVFQWLALSSLLGSTTDHYYLLLTQHREDLNTMRAEPADVIAWRVPRSHQEGFSTQTGALCTLDSKEGKKASMWICDFRQKIEEEEGGNSRS